MPGSVKIINKLYPSDYSKESSTLAIKLPMNNAKFDKTSQLFNMSNTTEEQVISNYINLLLTKSGERFMQPDFGVGLLYYIFEQNTDALQIVLKTQIRDQTAIWMPYVNLIDVKVDTYNNKLGDENSVNIQIIFSVLNSNANRVISVFANETQNINIEVQ
jgi:phage baseplate assembly protein W